MNGKFWFYHLAKFNCTIPGTLADFYEECNITTTSTILPTSIISPTVHVNTIATNTMNDIIIMTPTLSATDLEVNVVYIPLVVTMGIIIVILTISVLIMCIKKKNLITMYQRKEEKEHFKCRWINSHKIKVETIQGAHIAIIIYFMSL